MSRECPLCHERLCDDAPEANPRLAGRFVPTDEWPPTASTGRAALFPRPSARCGPCSCRSREDCFILPVRPGMVRRWVPGTTDYVWEPAPAKPKPLYRVVWGRGPTSTLPMPWPAVLRFVAAARKARPQYPIEVVAVPLSPTHPEEPHA